MFYSQFILAKKGPLGTIWIAAHLERKLRKNQVADTDIGVSVDSILFPDVPIALRLSSHLLVGVVRIYSRKVNYLFDDCSEALLKIKQAFRSTAVDLPPEESTAPYHSITLPETFDLDDFELPDNDMFQGNYVDHHISSREQITLQDTMEGVVFSTSQFGLDERFGDGDTSQIGLDIDEDLFLHKVASRGNDGDPKEIDETFEGIPGTSAIMEGYDADDQNAIPAAINEAPEHAQSLFAPEVGCMSPLDAHRSLPCDDLSEGHELKPEAVECAETDNRKSSDHATVPNSEENGYLMGDVEMNQVESPKLLASSMEVTREDASQNVCLSVSAELAKTLLPVPESSNGPDMHKPEALECEEETDVRVDIDNNNNKAGASLVDRTDAESPSCSQVTTELEDPGRRTCSVDVEFQNNMGESCSPSNKIALSVCPSESPDRPEVVNVEAQTFQEPKETDSTHERVEFPGLRPCNSSKQNDIPSFREEEPTDVVELRLDKRHVTENQLENVEGFEASEFPAPEKLLSVSEGLFSKQSDLVMESTPEKDDDSGAGDKLMSGKKRSFTETTLTVHSLNSGNSFTMNKSRRTAESIPGDDDLLSSILVGRKSSVLKLKPTPSASEIASTKRLRSAPRASSSKRKVVMDDMMVLHGDTIRLQLTNTEDIRRIRKKAPCTRPEISMLQRQFEEEFFSEPIFTGTSAELVSLHRETFDLSTIKMNEDDQEVTPVEMATYKDSSNVVRNDTETQDDHMFIQMENQPAEFTGVRSEQEILNNHDEMDRPNFEVTDVTDHNVLGPELSLQNDLIFNDLTEDITADILQPDLVAINHDADVPAMSPHKFDTGLAELANVHTTEAIENVDRDNDGAFETASLGTVGCDNMISGNGHGSVEGFENNDLTVVNSEVLCVECDEKDLTSICKRDEEVKDDTNFSLEPPINGENAILDGGNTDFKEADLALAVNTEIIAPESSATEFLGDFEDGTFGNDTEFLNVDDDEVAEDDEDYMPGAEDTRLPENTGWSSRTRAVSKYLQILFDKEPLHGRRVLAMDNLLTGKTRKEASRMFFETLVLKTKDYIHVEQPNPFDNINVKPRIKLMKADF